METNRIEYKQELSDSLEKEAVAFLNKGKIVRVGPARGGYWQITKKTIQKANRDRTGEGQK